MRYINERTVVEFRRSLERTGNPELSARAVGIGKQQWVDLKRAVPLGWGTRWERALIAAALEALEARQQTSRSADQVLPSEMSLPEAPLPKRRRRKKAA